MKYLPSLTQNPIILYTLRERQRNWRMNTVLFLALVSYLPCFLMFGFAIFRKLVSPELNFWSDLDKGGQIVFYATAFLLLLFVTLSTPMMALNAIAGEKQRQTLDLLRVTLLPERKIVSGKLISALIYPLILIALVWPLILLCLAAGGAEIMELIILAVLLLTTSVALTTISLFISSLSRSTTNAAMLTYGVALPLILIGPFLAMLPVAIILSFSERAISYGFFLLDSLNPITSAMLSINSHIHGGGWIMFYNEYDDYYILFPWVIYTIFYSLLTWFLIQLTTRRLERMNE